MMFRISNYYNPVPEKNSEEEHKEPEEPTEKNENETLSIEPPKNDSEEKSQSLVSSDPSSPEPDFKERAL